MQYKYIAHFFQIPQSTKAHPVKHAYDDDTSENTKRSKIAPAFISVSDNPLDNQSLVEHIGHKGAELSEMKRLGFNVGVGFSTTGQFYDDLLKIEIKMPGRDDIPKQSIAQHIEAIWTHYHNQYFSHNETSIAIIQKMCATISNVFDELINQQILNQNPDSQDPQFSALKNQLISEIRHYQNQSIKGTQQGFFVRSSGLGMEDMEGMSGAGQNATIPNVVGENNIVLAVIECFRSLWEPRSVKYRMDNRLPVTQAKMATVILETVSSMSNWIGFSLCNESGNRSVMKMTVQWGQGEGQVSGEQGALPDIIYCSKFLLKKRQQQEQAIAEGTLRADTSLVDPIIYRLKGRQTHMKVSITGNDNASLQAAKKAFETQTLPLSNAEKESAIDFLNELIGQIHAQQADSDSQKTGTDRRYSLADSAASSPDDFELPAAEIDYEAFIELLHSRHDLSTQTKSYLLIKSMGGGLVSETVPEELRDQFVFTDSQLIGVFSRLLQQEEHYSQLAKTYSGRDTEGGLQFSDHSGVPRLNKQTVSELEEAWLQSRDETVHSQKKPEDFKVIRLSKQKEYANRIPVLEGLAAGQMAGQGNICIVRMDDKKLMEHDLKKFKKGDILVGASADPDIGAVLKECHGFFVAGGGPNCHGFILARERNSGGYGMATSAQDGKCCIGGGGNMGDGSIQIIDDGSGKLKAIFKTKSGDPIEFSDGEFVTVDCSQADGVCRVYTEESAQSRVRFNERVIAKKDIPIPQITKIGAIAGNPIEALTYQQLMHDGDVRLLRMEFVYQSMLVDRDGTPIHPAYIGEWQEHFDFLSTALASFGIEFKTLLQGYIRQNKDAIQEMAQLRKILSKPEHQDLEYELDCYIRLAEASSGYPNPEEWAISKIKQTVNFYQSIFGKVSVRAFDLKKSEMNGNIGSRSKVGNVGNIMSENTRDDIIGQRGSSLFLDPVFQSTWQKIELKAMAAAIQDGSYTVEVTDPYTGETKTETQYRAKYFTVFNRTPQEFNIVRQLAQEAGIENIGVMCEVPENVIDIFHYYYDGTMFMSIGGNDLELGTHSIKRDGVDFSVAGLQKSLSIAMIKQYVTAAFASYYMGCPVSSCGNAPTDNAKLAKILTALPMDGFGIMPDKYPETCSVVVEAEKRILEIARKRHQNPDLTFGDITIEDRLEALTEFLTTALSDIAQEEIEKAKIPINEQKAARNLLVQNWVREIIGIERSCREQAIYWVNEQIRTNDFKLPRTDQEPELDLSGYLSEDESPAPQRTWQAPLQPQTTGPKRLYNHLPIAELTRAFPKNRPDQNDAIQVLAQNLKVYNEHYRQFSPQEIDQAVELTSYIRT